MSFIYAQICSQAALHGIISVYKNCVARMHFAFTVTFIPDRNTVRRFTVLLYSRNVQ